MEQLLEAQFWKDWGEIILAVVAIIIGFFYFRKGHKSKELTCSVGVFELINKSAPKLSKLTVKYGREPVEDLYIYTFRFQNTGDIPIVKNDFEAKMLIALATNKEYTTLLEVEVSERSPLELEVEAKIHNDGCEVSSGLLNPGDTFTISLFVSKKSESYLLTSRIIGIKKISTGNSLKVRQVKKATTFFLIASAVVMVSSMIYLGILMWNNSFNIKDPRTYLAITAVVIFGRIGSFMTDGYIKALNIDEQESNALKRLE